MDNKLITIGSRCHNAYYVRKINIECIAITFLLVIVKREHVKLKPPEVIAHAGAHVDRLFVRN